MILKNDLFISYYHEDQELVKAISNRLTKKGLVTWYDINMHKSKRNMNEIEENISNSVALLLIVSKKVKKSSWIPAEITIAKSKKIPIIPYLVDDITTSSYINEIISGINYIRAYSLALNDSINEIYKTVMYYKDKTYQTCNSKQLVENRAKISIERFIIEATSIDVDYYGEFAGQPDICLSWIKSNPEIYTLILTENKKQLIGYINAIPLFEDDYIKIKKGEDIDTFINCDAIRDYGIPGIYYMYFCSIAIKKTYCNEHAPFMLIFNAFLDLIIDLAVNRGIYFKEIAADSWTLKGEKIAKMYGMNFFGRTKHDTNMYVASLLPPKILPIGPKMKRIVSLYEKKAKEIM